MNAFIVFIAIVSLLGGVALVVWNFIKMMRAKEKESIRSRKTAEPMRPEKWKMPVKELIFLPAMLISFSLLLFLLSASLFEARDGFAYRVINPNGAKYAIMSPGYKLINPWARVTEWNKFIDIKTVPVGKDGNFLEPTDGIEGVIRGPISVRFTDQVTGSLYTAVRVVLPSDESLFLAVAEKYRHPDNLTNNTLIPTILEQISNATYMFTAEGYVNGQATEYKETIDDVLKHGGFKVRKVEYNDTVYGEEIGGDIMNRKRTIREIKKIYKTEPVLDANGVPVRYTHDINNSNLIIDQAIVDRLTLEKKFREKLEQQRDIAAEKSIEADKIDKAKISQQRIVAEGERDKSAERVKQEKEQVSKLIAIETKVKEEESQRQLAAIALETAKLNSQRIKVDADAKAYEIKNADGLSAEAKYRIDKEVEARIGVAEAMSKVTLPSTYVSGGGNAQGDLLSIYLAQMLKEQQTKK